MSHAHEHGLDHGHSHGHSHAHGHCHHGDGVSGGKMGLAVLITVAFVAAEAVAGLLGHSLALISDAGHNLADALALGLSWYAIWMCRKGSTREMTFGYHRVGILAALVNSVSLVVIALVIVYEAIGRLRNPAPTQGGLMIVVAAIAVVVNLVVGSWLHAGRHDLNIRAAYIHMVGDALSAFGVVIAGLIVRFAHSPIADPIASLIIALLILYSSWGILKQSVNVLLEGTPEGIDMASLENTITAVPGVLNVHDLHVWTVGSGKVACSCHVLVAEQTIREGQQVLRLVVDGLHLRFGINHTTVQVEVEGCEANSMYCRL